MSKIIDSYKRRTPNSADAHARAVKVLPGGNSRQVGYWPPYPLTIDEGKGVFIYDIDKNRYFDLTNNFTSLVHGHCYEPIQEVIKKQTELGLAWSANNAHQIDLAEQLAARIPSVDLVRFTNSGTEAGNLALQIARTVTGRRKVLMARRGYHGGLEEFGIGTFDLEGPDTITADYNDASSFEAALDNHGDEIAAVFLEAVQGAAGIRVADFDFLKQVCDATKKAGALFVLDEVITLRLAEGGMQSKVGLGPDLTMFGKLIGGGFPVGAVGGRKELLDIFNPSNQRAVHSGTFNGNPMTMAAGATAYRLLTQEKIDRMEGQAVTLEARLISAAKEQGLPITSSRYGSLLNIYFQNELPNSVFEIADPEMMTQFHIAGLNYGIFFASRGMFALSTVLEDAHLEEIIDRATMAMKAVAASVK